MLCQNGATDFLRYVGHLVLSLGQWCAIVAYQIPWLEQVCTDDAASTVDK